LIDLKKLLPSASMEITQIARKHKEKGIKIYTLSIGDTHFNLPESLASGLKNLPKESSHYGPAQGIAELRALIAGSYEGYTTDSVIIVPGLKQGFFYALSAIEGKRVAVLEPSWLGYQATCILSGCEYLPVNTYLPDWIETLRVMEFDVLMLCSPNNPDGRILNPMQIQLISDIIREKNAWVILDIIYERYSFNGVNIRKLFKPILVYQKTILGNGFSKSHAITGYRLGYLLIKEKSLVKDILKLQQNLATCASSHAQYLLIKNYNPAEIEDFVNYYRNNRRIVLDIFPEWKPYSPEGGFYFFVDLNIYGIQNAHKFCVDTLENHGIAMVPGSAYGTGFDSFVRISYSLELNELIEALNKLKILLNSYYAKINS